MANIEASDIKLASEEGLPWLTAFAKAHEIETLQDLLDTPLSVLQNMEGYNTHVQNEIIDIAQRYNMMKQLKQY